MNNINVSFPTIEIKTEYLPVQITERAVDRVKEVGSDYLRLNVISGGCSGFQYEFVIDEPQTDDDYVTYTNGVKLLIDPKSASLVSGSTVDYVSDIMMSQFVVDNPKASQMCGCGVSFTL